MVNIKNFFEPKSIAIIGASDRLEKVGGILLSKAMKSSIKVFPINPGHSEILGLKCYDSVLDVDAKIDLVVIAIPANFVVKSLEECGKKGIKNVILVSAGFSEVGNLKGEKEIVNVANKYGIRFIGANCFGICNPFNNLDLTFSKNTPRKGDIVFISQSGALWSYVSDLNIGFSGFVGLGNMENMDFNDFVEYFSKNKNTKKIVLYIEKLKDGKRFIEVCKRAIKSGKKIYAIKGGSSVVGEKAAISHTASLASDYEIYKGAFRQAGVVMCENFDELFIKNNKKKDIQIGKRTFIITNAGGAGVLISDLLSRKGIGIVEKPLDILGTALADDYLKAFENIVKPARGLALLSRKNFETLFVVLTPQSMSEIEKTAEIISKIKRELDKMNKKVVAVFLGGNLMKEANNIFEKNGVEFVNEIGEI
jgi:acyl-CoA synthetase (NDP forming)